MKSFILAAIAFLCLGLVGTSVHAESKCFGTAKSGRLENAESFPSSGKNFSVYTTLGHKLGRIHVHGRVLKVALAAYSELETAMPGTHFVLGETGHKNGGAFPPHKTHQNGLSIDFMVPVLDGTGKSVPLTCTVLNKWCYGLEFSKEGKTKKFSIDFNAITEHLRALTLASAAEGIKIRRVILDLDFVALLKKSDSWKRAPVDIVFSTAKPWVRHDEHYHVDFDLPCAPLK